MRVCTYASIYSAGVPGGWGFGARLLRVLEAERKLLLAWVWVWS